MTEKSDTIEMRGPPKAKQNKSDTSNCSERFSNVLERNIVSHDEVVVEIYIMTCKDSGKEYVGQAVSHILNHGKYRRYGAHGRFNSHISEAVLNTKKKQCRYLNNAIRKYGVASFSWKRLTMCDRADADTVEHCMMIQYKTVAPLGYNLKLGGQKFQHTLDSRLTVANGVQRFFDRKRIEKFAHCTIQKDIEPSSIIHPLRREGKQCGWYVMWKMSDNTRAKTDFGGTTRDIDDSYQRALLFVTTLQCKENM